MCQPVRAWPRSRQDHQSRRGDRGGFDNMREHGLHSSVWPLRWWNDTVTSAGYSILSRRTFMDCRVPRQRITGHTLGNAMCLASHLVYFCVSCRTCCVPQPLQRTDSGEQHLDPEFLNGARRQQHPRPAIFSQSVNAPLLIMRVLFVELWFWKSFVGSGAICRGTDVVLQLYFRRPGCW